MLSKFLVEYVDYALKYFEAYSVDSINVAIKSFTGLEPGDCVNWFLHRKDDPLTRKAILSAIKEDLVSLEADPEDRYYVSLGIEFRTNNGARVSYSDSIEVPETCEDDEEEEDTLKECCTPGKDCKYRDGQFKAEDTEKDLLV